MKITSLISLPEDELIIKLKHFKKYYNRALNHINKLSKNKLIKKSNELNHSLDDQIKESIFFSLENFQNLELTLSN